MPKRGPGVPAGYANPSSRRRRGFRTKKKYRGKKRYRTKSLEVQKVKFLRRLARSKGLAITDKHGIPKRKCALVAALHSRGRRKLKRGRRKEMAFY